jgi:hypothetical protein
MTQLTAEQITALETVGTEIARGYLEQGLAADPAYGFTADGDWMAVREAARAAGIEWTGAQPDEADRVEVWSAVERGYRSALA